MNTHIAVALAWATVPLVFVSTYFVMLHFFPVPSQEWLDQCVTPDTKHISCTWEHPYLHTFVSMILGVSAGIFAHHVTRWLTRGGES